jgi:hypothetical protein
MITWMRKLSIDRGPQMNITAEMQLVRPVAGLRLSAKRKNDLGIL